MLWLWLILTTAYGACVGSFLNVVILRLPAEQDLVRSPSACPKCSRRIGWYDNIPVLAWLWLRGRCRNCRAVISVQYPIIEAVTATLFGGLFALYYMTDMRQPWQEAGLAATWPVLLTHLVLIAGLIAASLIDGRYFIIPLAIPRVVTMLAMVALPVSMLGFSVTNLLAPTAGGRGVGAAAGGVVGLIIANLLLALGMLPHSFTVSPSQAKADEPADESADELARESADDDDHDLAWHPWRGIWREAMFTIVLAAIGMVVFWFQHVSRVPRDPRITAEAPRFDGTTVVAVMVGVILIVLLAGAVVARFRLDVHKVNRKNELQEIGDPQEWLSHPHPKREILKECLFLAFPVAGAMMGAAWLTGPETAYSRPVQVLAGCLLGYLVGGAIVWVTRIAGTLVFGKEAMGLGDVHLLGAIGAVLGWVDALVVFFMAPFFGLMAAVVLGVLGRLLKGPMRVIPYGPYLAGAAVLVMIFGGRDILRLVGIIVP